MSDRFSLDGRVAIITGGGTGIGRGTALVLAEHGADVVLAARRTGAARVDRATEIEALGRRALTVPTDVTSAEQCQRSSTPRCASSVVSTSSSTTPAARETKSIMKWTEDEWHQVLALNLGSVWFLSRAAAETHARARQGRDREHLLRRQPARHAPGRAVRRSQSRREQPHRLDGRRWTRKGVRVNTIAVGAVRAATLLDDAERYGLDPDAIGMTNASGRLGEPEEIGYGVLFFASDASSFCSGQTLYIHGGPGPAGV